MQVFEIIILIMKSRRDILNKLGEDHDFLLTVLL